MKTVHILRRVHGLKHSLRVDLRWKGKLHEDAVHIIALVQFRDQREHFFRRNRGGGRAKPASEAQLFARGDLAPHVYLRGDVFTY